MLRFQHKSLVRRPAAVTLLTGLALVSASLAPASAQALVKVGGHVPELVAHSTLRGTLAGGTPLMLAITLPVRDPAGLNDFVRGLYDPADARFGHYITPAEFGARFGATQAQYAAVANYLRSQGLTVTQTHPGRTLVDATGTAAQAGKAFGVAIKEFQAPDGHMFHAPDTEISVPKGLSIAAVVGLDDAQLPRPLAHRMRYVPDSEVDAASSGKPRVTYQNPPVNQGTGVGGGYSPSDLQTAYNLKGTTLSGAGQTVAMIEFGTGYNPKDILKFTSQYHLPRTPVSPVQVDGQSPNKFTGNAGETQLDIDAQIALAPGAKQILVFEGPNTSAANVDTLAAVYNDGRAKQLSISYGFGAEGTTSALTAPQASVYTALLQLTTAGVSVYASAGDNGNSEGGANLVQVDYLSSEPDLCSVGGTYLLVKRPGQDESYLSESTWNYDFGPTSTSLADGAGGGGVSAQWTIAPKSYTVPKNGSAPAYTLNYGGAGYQANAATFASAVSGSNVSSTMRNIPDISCVASPQTGFSIYVSSDPTSAPGWYVYGGTSLSAPLWAGYTALINQNLVRNGQAVLGFPNPTLYSLAYTPAGLTQSYASIFHDINDGSSNSTVTTNPVTFTAVTGFDDSTGLGSFNGVNLIQAISGPTP